MANYICCKCLAKGQNSVIQGTSEFFRLKVCKIVEQCKLRMAANRRALKFVQHFQEKCPHAAWVELELGHIRNELICLEDKIFQTKFHAIVQRRLN